MSKLTATKKGLFIASLVFLIDIITKYFAYIYISSNGQHIEINSFFNLVARWNKGVSFSLFSDSGKLTFYILCLLSFGIITALILWLRKEHKPLTVTALGLIIGGATGNLIDRIYNGAVFDFLDFHIGERHWPAFNFADSSIVIGAFMLIITCLIFNPNKEKGK